MSGGMPELGSKISLISKADIRYEGRLYTVDPQECTIALSSVRSFGTEDRDTQFQIAPQSQIYDYILFRGSDIKDIRVINNLPHPNDPAIMQVQLQNGQQLMPHLPMPSMNAPAPQMAPGSYLFGAMGGSLGNIGGAAGNSGSVGNVMAPGTGGPPPFLMGNQQQQQQQSQQQQQKSQQPQHKQPNDMSKQPDQITVNQQEPQMPLTATQSTEELKKIMPEHASNTTKLGISGRNSISTADIVKGNRSSVIGGGAAVVGGGIISDIHALGHNSTIIPSSSSASASASASASTKNLLSNAVALCEHKDQDMLTGGSRSTTPISLILRKSPSAEIGVQVNQQQQQQQQQHHNQMQHHSNQNNAGHGPNGGNKRQNQQQAQQNQQRGGNNQQRNNDFYHQQRQGGGRIQNNQQQQQQPHHDMRNNYNNQRNNNQGGAIGGGGPNRNWTMHRGGVPNNVMMRNRGGGRGRMQNQGFRHMGVPGSVNINKPRSLKSTIKFEQDFDFEQANNKFEELRSQLAKLKVGEEPKSEQINGETDKKDDSGNETGAGEHEHEDDEITVGYDKTKSFFDNISCETAQDRSKNKKNDWRQERKLNSETFGVSSTKRGSYRGRNNYYNRNVGNFNGGGTRGYRPGMNYRTRNNNNNRNNIGTNGASRDNNNGDANFENPTNNGTGAGTGTGTNTTNTPKNQVSQQQISGSGAGAATAGGSNATTGTNSSKSTPQQSSNIINPPKVAAVGE